MIDIISGVVAGILTTVLIALVKNWAWPNFKDTCLYNGVRVEGVWDITEVRNGKNIKAGKIELKQQGRIITGTSTRQKTRDGKNSDRKFQYHGSISGHQITLIFEDARGVGFDTGTYVFTLLNDSKTMVGMATFHGKAENKIVSEERTLSKAVS
ncbi:hypothetical protein I5O94_17275 [Serratia ureilytica]|uniref:hypothetical protein n=1 Tax=Serratia ureilytica TaxID=300181 RepID=UPI0018D39DB1|nr:hypothetical protein [Serratia ureilytica]MBH2695559.1 hypothetical protein [Serratia marcescens]MBH1926214.1 hypothetical protein [Serratia ureilytica]MBH2541891.1 hypothetical protein [Serratia ureilytica]MBH2805035.1 hypothetical protein [Serratia marcescens]MBN5234067.1 hypothetical protein [Serratia marcescens]